MTTRSCLLLSLLLLLPAGAATAAPHESSAAAREAEALAAALENATRAAYAEAISRRGDLGPAEAKSLEDMGELLESTRRFRREVGSRGLDLFLLEEEYRELHHAFRRATVSIYGVAGDELFERFDEVEAALDQLDRTVESDLLARWGGKRATAVAEQPSD